MVNLRNWTESAAWDGKDSRRSAPRRPSIREEIDDALTALVLFLFVLNFAVADYVVKTAAIIDGTYAAIFLK